jgi:hypothetical protein
MGLEYASMYATMSATMWALTDPFFSWPLFSYTFPSSSWFQGRCARRARLPVLYTDLFTSQMRAQARIGALALGSGSKLVLCERREDPTCPVFFWAPYLFDLFRSERAMVRYSLASCQHTVFSRSATELNQGLPVFYSVLLLSFTSDETRQHRSLGSRTNDIYGRQLKGYKDLST